MPKQKSHKGLLKRVKVTASGKVRFKKPFRGHLNSHMSGNKLRQLRGAAMIKRGDIARLGALLHRPLRAADTD